MADPEETKASAAAILVLAIVAYVVYALKPGASALLGTAGAAIVDVTVALTLITAVVYAIGMVVGAVKGVFT